MHAPSSPARASHGKRVRQLAPAGVSLWGGALGAITVGSAALAALALAGIELAGIGLADIGLAGIGLPSAGGCEAVIGTVGAKAARWVDGATIVGTALGGGALPARRLARHATRAEAMSRALA
jgi:hypothetical protein